MRKIICAGMAMVVFLLVITGCNQNFLSNNPNTNFENNTTALGGLESSGNFAGTTGGSQSSVPVEVIPPTSPDDPVGTIIPFDPEREIYLLCDGMSLTIYKDFSGKPSISLYILSKKELDIGAISLDISARSQAAVSIGEIPLGGTGLENRDIFTYALYQCYMGKDFAKLWELETIYNACHDAYFEEEEISYEEYKAAEQAYISFRDEEKGSYMQLTENDLPDFHVYYASATFMGEEFYEETITQAHLRIGDQTYTLALGEITLTKQAPSFPVELDWYNGGGYAYDGIIGSGNGPCPYNDGVHRVESYFSFTAEHSMVLTDLQLDNPNHELVAVWIDMVSADGGTFCGQWDMTEPFLLMPGDRVKIHIAYRDEGVESLSYNTKVWGYLIYEWDNGFSCKLSECDIRSGARSNYYELYALIFDGLDLESYYRDYFYPKYESWRYELDESLVG